MLETSFRIVKGRKEEGMLQELAEKAVEAYAVAAERSGNLCEVSFESCKLGLTLALARSPVGPRQRSWCTLSVIDVNFPDDSEMVSPTDELVRINGSVVAIRDDDDFDDLDRILAFDELKETIRETRRPVRLTFVRTDGRRRKDATRALAERHSMSLQDKPVILARVKVQGEKLRYLVDQLGTKSEADAATARAVSRMARARAIRARQAYRYQLAPKQVLLEARATDAYVTARRAFVTSKVLAVLEQAEFDRIANMMTLDDRTLDDICKIERLLEAGLPDTSSRPPESSHVSPPPIFESDHHQPALKDASKKPLCVFTRGAVNNAGQNKPLTIFARKDDDDEFGSSDEEKILVGNTEDRSSTSGAGPPKTTSSSKKTKNTREGKGGRQLRRRRMTTLPSESSSSSSSLCTDDFEILGDAAEIRRVRATKKLVREVSMEASVAAMRAELLVSRLSSEEAHMVSSGSNNSGRVIHGRRKRGA